MDANRHQSSLLLYRVRIYVPQMRHRIDLVHPAAFLNMMTKFLQIPTSPFKIIFLPHLVLLGDARRLPAIQSSGL